MEQILHYLQGFPYRYEIIIADDGSKDRTVELGQQWNQANHRIKVIKAPQNMGKGAATKRGMLAAQGKYRLFTDADNSTPIEELEKVMAHLKGKRAQVAIGSRALAESNLEQRQPWHRELMGRVFNKVVQSLAVPGIQDTQCGFKLFTEEAAQKLFNQQKLNGFSFDVELLFLARKNHFKIAEVPIRWINNEESKVSPIKDSIRVFRDVMTIRSLHR